MVEGGMVICEGLDPDRSPLDFDAGRQMCSPREERGMGSAQEEQVTVGKATEARSMCGDRAVKVDMTEMGCEGR